MPPRTTTTPQASNNRPLARLLPKTRRAFAAHCEPVELTFDAVLAEPDREIEYVHFPLTGFVSVMVPAEAGASLEVGLIGREGMLGATIAREVDSAPLHGLVQGAGTALRMTAAKFRRQLNALPELRASILRYSYVLLRQVSQMAVRTRYHTVKQRLARWLLMTQDGARGAEFHLTQEFLGQMLGVRRVGVTQAAGALQKRGPIGYRRAGSLPPPAGAMRVTRGCMNGHSGNPAAGNPVAPRASPRTHDDRVRPYPFGSREQHDVDPRDSRTIHPAGRRIRRTGSTDDRPSPRRP